MGSSDSKMTQGKRINILNINKLCDKTNNNDLKDKYRSFFNKKSSKSFEVYA